MRATRKVFAILLLLASSVAAWAGAPPLALPSDATNVDYNSAGASLAFDSPSSVKTIAAFYTDAMKKMGWMLQPTDAPSDEMAAMVFTKGDEELTFAMMLVDDHTQVSAAGTLLLGK